MGLDEIPVWTFRTGLSTMMTAERRTPRRETTTFLLAKEPVAQEKRDQRIEISLAVKTQNGQTVHTANISKNGLRTIATEGDFQQQVEMDLLVQI